MKSEMNRRTFVKVAAAGAAAGFASPRAHGANERIRLGCIGVANRGGQLIDATLPHKDEKQCAKLDGKPEKYGDFRKILERKDIDAVVIATPDHWHAIQTIDACDAGKDVYVEKPLSMTIHEGRRMVEAARRNKRIVQVGTHRRASKMYAEIAEFVQGGGIGDVTVARAYRLSNMSPTGIGKMADSEPPDDLDWDMWLGPRAFRPYRANITPYKFRWWKNYSSQLGNWGVHYFDAIRWIIGEEAPSSVVSLGSNLGVDDDRTIPVSMETTCLMPSGQIVIFGQYEASSVAAMKRGHIELRGTQGAIYVDDRGYEIVPERGGQFQDPKPRMEPADVKAGGGNMSMTELNMRNFLDCMKSRETPNADVEIGHRSTTFSHLGNIAPETGSRINWDAKAERITNNEKANDLLHYEYRPPWKLG